MEISLPATRDVTTAEFLNDGRLAYVQDDRLLTLKLPNGPKGEVRLLQPKTHPFRDVGFMDSPSWLKVRRDGMMVAGAHHADTIIWDIANARLRPVTSPALTDASSLNWSRSGVIAWGDYQSGVRAWRDASGEPLELPKALTSATTLAFDRDGRHLVASDSSSVKLLDLQSRRVVSSLDVPSGTQTGMGFTPDGTRLGFASSEGLAVFDLTLRLQTRLAKLDEHTSAEHVAFSPDGRWVAAALGGPQSSVKVWPVAGGSAVTLDTARMTYGPQPLSFNSDSRWVASFSKGQSLALWLTGSWKLERTWGLPGTGRALAFAPQGSRLAIAADGEAAIWDATSGMKLVTLRSPGSSQARQIAWSPDGNRVLTSADDGVLQFWNASNGQHLASLYALARSQDWLLVASDGRIDGSARPLASVVAWRAGDQVSLNKTMTDRHHVNGLWRLLRLAGQGR
jgi:WD40 repeat protein